MEKAEEVRRLDEFLMSLPEDSYLRNMMTEEFRDQVVRNIESDLCPDLGDTNDRLKSLEAETRMRENDLNAKLEQKNNRLREVKQENERLQEEVEFLKRMLRIWEQQRKSQEGLRQLLFSQRSHLARVRSSIYRKNYSEAAQYAVLAQQENEAIKEKV